MRILCPSCDTGFSVENRLIGPKGRKLRCARCEYQWHYVPPPEDTNPFSNSVGIPMAEAIHKGQSPISAFSPPPLPTENSEAASTGGKRKVRRKAYVFFTAFACTILLVGGLLLVLGPKIEPVQLWLERIILRKTMENRPEIANVKFTRQQQDGKDVILVEGTLFNPTQQILEIPPMAAIGIDHEGKEVLPGRSFALLANQIQPGESIQFQTILLNLPKQAEHLRIGFAK